MRWTKLLIGALLLPAATLAQMGSMGGGNMGSHGGRGSQGGPPGDGQGTDRPSPPRSMKPLKRDKFDKAVASMFRSADVNGDGSVTPEELRSVIEGRRQALIRARFARIDRNRNGSIDLDEFSAWQRSLGSVASSEEQALGGDSVVSEVIEPEIGNGPDDRILALLVEPLSSIVIVNANVHYNAGITLEELLAYERQRFDAMDTNHDGEISMEEARSLRPDGRPGKEGGRFGGGRPPPPPQ